MNLLQRILGIMANKNSGKMTTPFDEYQKELEAKNLSSMDDLESLVKPLIKQATKIVLEPASRPPENSQLNSQFGGDPYFEEGESWPSSADGTGYLNFIFQIFDDNSHFLPEGIQLIQFFYNFDESPWNTEDQGWLVKSYFELNKDKKIFIERPQGLTITKYCEISYEKVESLPDWEGLDLHSNTASKLSYLLNEDDPWESYDTLVEKLIGEQSWRSQLGGYPKWVQGESTPKKADGGNMELLFQIDSEDNAGLMWGDTGLVYVFYDSENPSEFEFTLQCY